jgi:membrane protein
MFAAFHIPLSWSELLKRTAKESSDDDILGLAAQLAYYFFLALFPAVLFILALASFFPLTNVIDDIVGALRPIAPADVLRLVEDQLRRISNADSGGILTIGILGAIWSSSAAVIAIVGSLNRAYDIEEGRPWWKVRLTAIALTLGLAVLVLASFTLIVAGPAMASQFASSFGLGPTFDWTWKILQWPVAFLLVSTAVGLVYYFAPDAEQEWAWITPGAVIATLLWLVVSLVFKFYLAHFADYNATYGAVGGVIVLMLWFYISGLAILVGAELNAEIEHASPYGKEPGEKAPGQKKKIGAAAARAYKERLESRNSSALIAAVPQLNERGHTMTTNKDERSLGEMFAELSRETRTLVQQELQLAKTELTEKASKMGKGAGLLVGGGLIAYGGLLAIIAAIVLVLIAIGLPSWAAALVGGVVVAGIGYLLIRSGLAVLRPQELTPRKTIDMLKEDAQWLKAQVK